MYYKAVAKEDSNGVFSKETQRRCHRFSMLRKSIVFTFVREEGLMSEYMTICEESPLAFDSVINNLLRQGWELYGYPYTAVDVGKYFFCQAMVRYKKEEIK